MSEELTLRNARFDVSTGTTTFDVERLKKTCGGGGYYDRVYFIHKNDLCILDGEKIIEIDHEDVTPKHLPPHQ